MADWIFKIVLMQVRIRGLREAIEAVCAVDRDVVSIADPVPYFRLAFDGKVQDLVLQVDSIADETVKIASDEVTTMYSATTPERYSFLYQIASSNEEELACSLVRRYATCQIFVRYKARTASRLRANSFQSLDEAELRAEECEDSDSEGGAALITTEERIVVLGSATISLLELLLSCDPHYVFNLTLAAALRELRSRRHHSSGGSQSTQGERAAGSSDIAAAKAAPDSSIGNSKDDGDVACSLTMDEVRDVTLHLGSLQVSPLPSGTTRCKLLYRLAPSPQLSRTRGDRVPRKYMAKPRTACRNVIAQAESGDEEKETRSVVFETSQLPPLPTRGTRRAIAEEAIELWVLCFGADDASLLSVGEAQLLLDDGDDHSAPCAVTRLVMPLMSLIEESLTDSDISSSLTKAGAVVLSGESVLATASAPSFATGKSSTHLQGVSPCSTAAATSVVGGTWSHEANTDNVEANGMGSSSGTGQEADGPQGKLLRQPTRDERRGENRHADTVNITGTVAMSEIPVSVSHIKKLVAEGKIPQLGADSVDYAVMPHFREAGSLADGAVPLTQVVDQTLRRASGVVTRSGCESPSFQRQQQQPQEEATEIRKAEPDTLNNVGWLNPEAEEEGSIAMDQVSEVESSRGNRGVDSDKTVSGGKPSPSSSSFQRSPSASTSTSISVASDAAYPQQRSSTTPDAAPQLSEKMIPSPCQPYKKGDYDSTPVHIGEVYSAVTAENVSSHGEERTPPAPFQCKERDLLHDARNEERKEVFASAASHNSGGTHPSTDEATKLPEDTTAPMASTPPRNVHDSEEQAVREVADTSAVAAAASPIVAAQHGDAPSTFVESPELAAYPLLHYHHESEVVEAAEGEEHGGEAVHLANARDYPYDSDRNSKGSHASSSRHSSPAASFVIAQGPLFGSEEEDAASSSSRTKAASPSLLSSPSSTSLKKSLSAHGAVAPEQQQDLVYQPESLRRAEGVRNAQNDETSLGGEARSLRPHTPPLPWGEEKSKPISAAPRARLYEMAIAAETAARAAACPTIYPLRKLMDGPSSSNNGTSSSQAAEERVAGVLKRQQQVLKEAMRDSTRQEEGEKEAESHVAETAARYRNLQESYAAALERSETVNRTLIDAAAAAAAVGHMREHDDGNGAANDSLAEMQEINALRAALAAEIAEEDIAIAALRQGMAAQAENYCAAQKLRAREMEAVQQNMDLLHNVEEDLEKLMSQVVLRRRDMCAEQTRCAEEIESANAIVAAKRRSLEAAMTRTEHQLCDPTGGLTGGKHSLFNEEGHEAEAEAEAYSFISRSSFGTSDAGRNISHEETSNVQLLRAERALSTEPRAKRRPYVEQRYDESLRTSSSLLRLPLGMQLTAWDTSADFSTLSVSARAGANDGYSMTSPRFAGSVVEQRPTTCPVPLGDRRGRIGDEAGAPRRYESASARVCRSSEKARATEMGVPLYIAREPLFGSPQSSTQRSGVTLSHSTVNNSNVSTNSGSCVNSSGGQRTQSTIGLGSGDASPFRPSAASSSVECSLRPPQHQHPTRCGAGGEISGDHSNTGAHNATVNTSGLSSVILMSRTTPMPLLAGSRRASSVTHAAATTAGAVQAKSSYSGLRSSTTLRPWSASPHASFLHGSDGIPGVGCESVESDVRQQQPSRVSSAILEERERLSLLTVEHATLLEAIDAGDRTVVFHLFNTKPHLIAENDNLLHAACATASPDLDVVEALLTARPEFIKGIDLLTGNTALHFACGAQRPNVAVVRCLIVSGVDMTLRNRKGLTAFHVAVLNANDAGAHHRVKDALLAVGSASVDERTDLGATALHLVCGSDQNLSVVRYLVARGADLTTLSSYAAVPVVGGVSAQDRDDSAIFEVTALERSDMDGAIAVGEFLSQQMA